MSAYTQDPIKVSESLPASDPAHLSSFVQTIEDAFKNMRRLESALGETKSNYLETQELLTRERSRHRAVEQASLARIKEIEARSDRRSQELESTLRAAKGQYETLLARNRQLTEELQTKADQIAHQTRQLEQSQIVLRQERERLQNEQKTRLQTAEARFQKRESEILAVQERNKIAFEALKERERASREYAQKSQTQCALLEAKLKQSEDRITKLAHALESQQSSDQQIKSEAAHYKQAATDLHRTAQQQNAQLTQIHESSRRQAHQVGEQARELEKARAELKRLRDVSPLKELVAAKDQQIEKITRELEKIPDGDSYRSEAIEAFNKVSSQRDRLAALLRETERKLQAQPAPQ